MGIIVGIYGSAKGRRDEKKVRAELKALELAIHNFHIDQSYYPPDNPGNASSNGLFGSLTQGLKDGKKNYLQGAQIKHDGLPPEGGGNLIAPVDDPDNPDGVNFWRYISGDPTNNLESYDIWAPVGISGETVKIGNWED